VSIALVTGATGLVGSHIVDLLLDQGWTVRALARQPTVARDELPPRVEVVQGDVLDEHSFVRAAAGCHTVFHSAADVITRGGWEAYRATNIDGTRNAVAAAERAGARLLQVSSVAVYGSASRYDAAGAGGRTDEFTPMAPLSERAYYGRSKRESEQLVLDAHRQGRVWAAAVRPCVVYGRRDRQFVPRMARVLRRRLLPLLNGGRSVFGVVHAANVASGCILAATTDAAGGNAYNLANDFDITVRRFFELAGEALDARPLFVPVPVGVARVALRSAKRVMRALGGERFNLVSVSTVDFIAEDNPFSSDRAKRELGWRPTVRHEDGVPDAFRWWAAARAG